MEENNENREPIMVFPPPVRTHQLGEGEYFGKIGKIRTKSMRAQDDKVVTKVLIPFKAYTEPCAVVFEAEIPITYDDRFHRFLEELLGGIPADGYDLCNLEDCEASFCVIHRHDVNGEIWDEVEKAIIFY